MRARLLIAVLAALPCAAMSTAAVAQVASSPVQPASAGWTFNVTPYFWLTTFRTNLNFTGPQGNTVSSSITSGINDYITHLNYAVMGGAEARYDRFSVFADLISAGLSFKNDASRSRLDSVTARGVTIPIERELQVFTGSRDASTIGSLGAGYTLLSGDWGNLDALAGMRILGYSSTFNYGLAADITTPLGGVALSRSGSLSLGQTLVEGVGGVKGRVNIGSSPFYVPFYLDAGGGAIPFTWQIYAGLAYKAGFADLSLGYRWLDFQGSGTDKPVKNLSLGGALLAASFHF